MTRYVFGDRVVETPVQVRSARSWTAQFPVGSRAAQSLVGPAGLQVVDVWPGTTLCSILFVRYRDSDLDAYNEVAVAFTVREPGTQPGAWRDPLDLARGRIGVYIHSMPVDQTFTLEAGRGIWGYPKWLAQIDIDDRADAATCTLRDGDDLVLRLRVANGRRFPMPLPSVPTFTSLDGVLRRTTFTMKPRQAQGRPGGATLEVGRDHPLANDLRSLGLPRRALATQILPTMRASFNAPVVVERSVGARP